MNDLQDQVHCANHLSSGTSRQQQILIYVYVVNTVAQHSTMDGISLGAHKPITTFLKGVQCLQLPEFPKSPVKDSLRFLESLKTPAYDCM